MKFLLLVFSLIFSGFAYSAPLQELISKPEVLGSWSVDEIILNYKKEVERSYYNHKYDEYSIPNAYNDPNLYDDAEDGDDDAQFLIGSMSYKAGFLEDALHWFKISAEEGNLKAETLLGVIHYIENGNRFLDAGLVSIDHREAYYWLEEEPSRIASILYAVMEALGQVYPKDVRKAIVSFRDIANDYSGEVGEKAAILYALLAHVYSESTSENEKRESMEILDDAIYEYDSETERSIYRLIRRNTPR